VIATVLYSAQFITKKWTEDLDQGYIIYGLAVVTKFAR